MCIILAFTKPLSPTKLEEEVNTETLETAISRNPDGFGMAWWNKDVGTWEYVRGLTSSYDMGGSRWSAEKILKLLKETPYPKALHFRLGTVGQKDVPYLCHPFPLPLHPNVNEERGQAKYLLMHNGHISGWESMLSASLSGKVGSRFGQIPRENISDTKALVMYLTHLAKETKKGVERDSLRYLASFQHGRIAFFKPDGTIEKFGSWSSFGPEDKGILASNSFISPASEEKRYSSSFYTTSYGYGGGYTRNSLGGYDFNSETVRRESYGDLWERTRWKGSTPVRKRDDLPVATTPSSISSTEGLPLFENVNKEGGEEHVVANVGRDKRGRRTR